MAARRDPLLASAIRSGDLISADGVGVVLAARTSGAAGDGRLGRVTGVDIVDWLAAESGPAEAPLFLLGAGVGVAAAAADALRRRYSGARIAGWWAGGTPRVEDDEEALARIRASGARVVAVAYGAPGQVLWIARNREALAAAGVRLAVGVGGALDYVAGRVPRAPAVMRRCGLEWLYRLAREPRRWRRQLVLPVFAVMVVVDWTWRRGNRGAAVARLKGVAPPHDGTSGDAERG